MLHFKQHVHKLDVRYPLILIMLKNEGFIHSLISSNAAFVG